MVSRLPRAVFSQKPYRRVNFGFGVAAYVRHNPPAVAIVVSKKVAKSAVLRNRIRRRVRAALPSITESVILYPAATAARATFADLRAALANAIKPR